VGAGAELPPPPHAAKKTLEKMTVSSGRMVGRMVRMVTKINSRIEITVDPNQTGLFLIEGRTIASDGAIIALPGKLKCNLMLRLILLVKNLV
jgi:hypothetical protein